MTAQLRDEPFSLDELQRAGRNRSMPIEVEQPWNLQAMGNNLVQRIAVIVR